MAAMETQGRDINMSENRIAGYRNFATKLWNAARFGEMNEAVLPADFDESKVKSAVNKWIIAKAKQASGEVTDNLNAFRFRTRPMRSISLSGDLSVIGILR